MTEIAWLVKLMTSFPLTEEVKSFCLERIGEVENKTSQVLSPQYMIPVGAHSPQVIAPGVVQYQNGPPMSAAQLRDLNNIVPAVPAQPAQIAQLKPSGEVVTSQTHGGSTRGPNKMRGRL